MRDPQCAPIRFQPDSQEPPGKAPPTAGRCPRRHSCADTASPGNAAGRVQPFFPRLEVLLPSNVCSYVTVKPVSLCALTLFSARKLLQSHEIPLLQVRPSLLELSRTHSLPCSSLLQALTPKLQM